jgi:hypothetical protein
VETNEFVPSLMFMTLGAVLLIAIVAFGWFLRKRRNRDLATRAFQGDERESGTRVRSPSDMPPR